MPREAKTKNIKLEPHPSKRLLPDQNAAKGRYPISGEGDAPMDPRKKPANRIVDGDGDKPIPEKVYPTIDTDLARDNLENDLPAADLQDL